MQPVCWKCGEHLEDDSLPIGRLDECPCCHAELHVCLACVFFDRSVAKSCREPIAEEVTDKRRANFCDYFQLRPDAYQPKDDSAAIAARAQLDALFGATKSASEGDPAQDTQREALDALFKPPPKKS